MQKRFQQQTKWFGLFFGLALSGCASVQSVSLTPIPPQRNNVVRSQVEKTIFLAFNFDNDFVDPLVSDLKRQCPEGVVSGVLTKHEVISYFLVFKERITATGFCSKGSAVSQAPLKRRTASEEAGTSEESREGVQE